MQLSHTNRDRSHPPRNSKAPYIRGEHVLTCSGSLTDHASGREAKFSRLPVRALATLDWCCAIDSVNCQFSPISISLNSLRLCSADARSLHWRSRSKPLPTARLSLPVEAACVPADCKFECESPVFSSHTQCEQTAEKQLEKQLHFDRTHLVQFDMQTNTLT